MPSISQKQLITTIKNTFEQTQDQRKGKNTQYKTTDAILSAFSVFFTQSPSFLDYQRNLEKTHQKNNLQTLFGTHKTPTDNQIRNILDSVNPENLYPIYRHIYNTLKTLGKIKEYQVLKDQTAILLDGTQHHQSTKIHCDHCIKKQQKDGTTSYSHSVITPVIASPEQTEVIPLAPEFISNQDGEEKQDCELKASERWLNREYHNLPEKVTLLGDDLLTKPYMNG